MRKKVKLPLNREGEVESLKYFSDQEKTAVIAMSYHTNTSQNAYRYLAYREISGLVKKYAHGKRTLDYGAGTGISTQFLLNQGLLVDGVDVNTEMLDQAKVHCPEANFYKCKNGFIPVQSNAYDLIFSSFVFLEIPSEKECVKYLSEGKRVLKSDGVFIAVTGSHEFYSRNWLSFKTDYPENKNLKSGAKAKIVLIKSGMEFTDFYWTEQDYCNFFEKSGLSLVEILYPLGKASEPFPWKDETKYPPFAILVAKHSLVVP